MVSRWWCQRKRGRERERRAADGAARRESFGDVAADEKTDHRERE